MFVGWDWASESHDVTVLDDAGGVVERFSLQHTECDLSAALTRLARLGGAEYLPVAIERPNGLVVDRLLAAGHPVVPVHPNSFHAARARWSASRAKSDPADSYMLADYLRTDGHRLPRLRPLDATSRSLQALVRMRADHVAAKTAASNQLHALLEAHWPGANAIFSRLGSTIALDFLDDYPTPESAARLGEARLAMFWRRHSYRGGRRPRELLDRLRSAPAAPIGLDPDTLAEAVRAQVQLLRSTLRTIARLDQAIGAALLDHPKTRLLRQLPRVGEISLAQLIAEVGPVLERVADVEHAAAACGVVPVTRESGKGRTVTFRYATNTRARFAITTFADNSRHASPWAAQLYRDARRRGVRHPQAIRIVARAWTRVLWACWHTNTPYDPHRHRAEQRLAS
jgi:transposase